ncbi:uncharacterized protein LOC143074683 [Mytilus galloprovincialis]|uniref:uncharacterized protein LOC143074683 n=1 Tax=Mytilus galloprovincialis TaxID=29158 RepID=UPI003F7B49A5
MYMDSGITYNINDNAARTLNFSTGKHFKSDIINHWKDIDIDQVKLVVYQDGMEKSFLHFDGTGTDKINWFSQEGLLNSSYSDLKTASPDVNGYHFAVEGYSRVRRRFFVSKSFGGCSEDFGWLLVSGGFDGACSYEPANTLTILYSTGYMAMKFEELFQNGYKADTLGIFVTFKSSTCQPLTSQADNCSTPVQLASIIYCYRLCNKSSSVTNLQEKIQKLKKELSVSERDTSKYRRSLTSARDDRYSSKTIGLVGALGIALVVGFIVTLDSVKICQKCSKINKVTTENTACSNEMKRGNPLQGKA